MLKEKYAALIVIGIILFLQIILLFTKHFIYKIKVYLSRQVSKQVRVNLLTKMLEMEPTQMAHFSDGKIYSLIVRDSEAIPAYVFTVLNSIYNILNVVSIGIVILLLCYPLAIVIIVTYPLLYLTNRYFGKKLKKQQVVLLGELDSYTSFFKDIVTNLDDFKANGGCERIETKFADKDEGIKARSLKMDMLKQWNSNCSSIIGLLNFVSINIIGLLLVIVERLSLGNFIAFNSYSTSFTSSLNSIVSLNADLQPTFVVLDRLKEVDSLLGDYKIKEKYRKDADIDHVKIEKLCLKFGEREVFRELSFGVEPGDIIKIQGKNGCGKTSLLRILKRELDYQGGIYVDSTNYRDISYPSIQRHILFLRQSPVLIRLSLFDNLTLLSNYKEIDEAMVIEACKKTTLWEDIERLPAGLNTNIDDNFKLSAGQIQKIQLTRALLSNAKIILCDEIFANLDKASQQIAIEILKELNKKGKTVLFISHQTDVFIQNCLQLKLD